MKGCKTRIYKRGRLWYASTEFEQNVFDMETCVIAVGETPEQAYNEWERLVGRRMENRKEDAYVWLWLTVPSLLAGVLVWIFG